MPRPYSPGAGDEAGQAYDEKEEGLILMEENKSILITTSPHLHEGSSTRSIMLAVTICLLPAGIWGVVVFGLRVLAVLLTAIVASVLTEAVISRALKRNTLPDCSAILTGLLVGYNMPPSVPLFIPAVASVFAIAVVKMTFGGLGRNWMNPALAGRVFVTFSWTGPMTTWLLPRTWGGADAATGASVLGFIKAGLIDGSGGARGPAQFLALGNYPHSPLDLRLTQWLNSGLFGGRLEAGYVDLFVGNIPGCIGEVSALLLLLGSVYLFARKIITWEIPVTYLATFSVLVWVFGGLRFDSGFFHGDVLFHLFSGGLMLGALYMATDMVTSPLTSKGMIIFGVGAGFLTFLIRFYGSFPEGVSLAIILMNMFVPLINRITKPVKFGYLKEAQQ
jgi:electron transport complex protein RnfD